MWLETNDVFTFDKKEVCKGVEFEIYNDDYGQSTILAWKDEKGEICQWCCGTYNDYHWDMEDIADNVNERKNRKMTNTRVKLKDGHKVEELEKYGFNEGIYTRSNRAGVDLYYVFVTPTHHYLEVRMFNNTLAGGYEVIVGSLQTLFTQLALDGLTEVVDVDNE